MSLDLKQGIFFKRYFEVYITLILLTYIIKMQDIISPLLYVCCFEETMSTTKPKIMKC